MGKTPPKGKEAEGSPPKKSPRRQDTPPAAAGPLPTVPESSELIVEGAEGASDKKRCKCNYVITYGNIIKLARLLESKDAWTCCDCRDEDRRGIVKTRPPKRDILICGTCYDHLCCGVGSIAYPYGHSRAHAQEKEHWVAILYCDPERGFCFKCNAEVPMPVKFEEGNNEVGLQVICNIVKRKLLAPLPSVGALITASAPRPTGKTPPKGDEAEESPPKKALRLFGVDLLTVPGASEPNPTGKTLPKEEASDEKRCNCNHVITDSAIKELSAMKEVSPSLKSKDALTCFDCLDEDEERIVKTRPPESDLLICVTCCDHLCCGVGSIAYPYGHSRAHAQEKEHWVAVLYRDPKRGFCFKCNAEVRMVVSQKLRAPLPSIGQTEAEVNPKKAKRTGKVQTESHPSGQSSGRKYRSSDAQGYAIRGIKNLGNTCYMSAVLQCLFALGKLGERMLALDHPKGLLPAVLKRLFVEASAAGDDLDPMEVTRVLTLVSWGWVKRNSFKIGTMEDSHEFLMALRDVWNDGEKIYDKQSNAPTTTMIDSIFGFEMLQTISCKKCGPRMQTHFQLDLTLMLPSKQHPTKSAASPQTIEGPRSHKRDTAFRFFPADVQRNLEKMQIVSESGYSRVIGPEVIVEKTHKPLEVDSTQAQRISRSKDVVQSPLQIQKGKSVDSVTEDSISIEDLFLLNSKGEVVCCSDCAKDHEEPSANQSKNGEQIVGSSNGDDVGDTVKTSHFLTLPPVLTLHLNRTSSIGTKISGHVRFMEDLDVTSFKHTSSLDQGSTRYCLAGVVEHIGEGSLNSGHYIAYVRARKLGNQHQSSWFRAEDNISIEPVTLDDVLKIEAYILFYERMED